MKHTKNELKQIALAVYLPVYILAAIIFYIDDNSLLEYFVTMGVVTFLSVIFIWWVDFIVGKFE